MKQYVLRAADKEALWAAQAMAGFAVGDLHAASMWKAWVAAMQRHCGELIRRKHDEPWPALPAGVADLAGRF